MRPVHVIVAVVSALVVGSVTVAAPRIDIPGITRVRDEGTPLAYRPNLNFTGANISCTDDAANNETDCNVTGGGGSGGYDQIQDEGTNLTQRTTLDFVGAGVTCTDTGTKTQCSIPGGAGTITQRLELGVNGAGGPVTTGAKGRKTFSISGTIVRWRLVSDVATTTTLDIWKANGAIPTNANSITGSAKPSLTAAELSTSTTLTGWTTAVTAGDVFILEVESNDLAQYLFLELEMTVP